MEGGRRDYDRRSAHLSASRMGEKHLRMLTFIHGGPADANGDSFEADWYDWANLAVQWVVGLSPELSRLERLCDDFMLQIAPHLVSVQEGHTGRRRRPGKRWHRRS